MNYEKKLNKNNKGFTLLELILTVVILALVTAPFLSSFVSASRANQKSKRIQEANELGEYIIEQFKATSVDQLVTTYKLTADGSYIIDSATGSAYNKNSTKYTGKVSKNSADAALPTGMRKGYTAELTLTPAKNVVNADYAIPVIDNLDKKVCAVFNKNITKYDNLYTGASSRKVTIEVEKSASKYTVKLIVDIKNVSGSILGTNSITWEYDTVPSVYVLYKPLSVNDEIEIKNNIYNAADFEVAGEKKNVGVYIINQKDSTGLYYNSMPASRIKVYEASSVISGNTYTLNNLISPTSTSSMLTNTTLYTNIGDVKNNLSASKDNGNVNDTVKMIKIDTVYNLDVTVKYNGKKVSDYNSTKVVGE